MRLGVGPGNIHFKVHVAKENAHEFHGEIPEICILQSLRKRKSSSIKILGVRKP